MRPQRRPPSPINNKQRQEIDALVEEKKSNNALLALKEYWLTHRNAAAASWILERINKIRSSLTPALMVRKIYVLRSFTLEPVLPFLRAEAINYGLDLDIQVGGFNAYPQEILDPHSALYNFAPDITFLAVQLKDLRPDLYREQLEEAEIEAILAESKTNFRNWLDAFRQRSQSNLVIHNLEQGSTAGNATIRQSKMLEAASRNFNEYLKELAASYTGIYLLDYFSLVKEHGEQWFDPQKELQFKLPLASQALLPLAQEWLRFIVPLSGKTCKVLAIDLDDTIWKGTAAEDGLAGVAIGGDGAGAAFQALQQAILELMERGILLAIASKNNKDDALEILDHHPNMLFGSKDIASMQINWNNKAENLRQIAQDLNIGLDTMAFLDNDPVERASVKSRLPEVFVVALPDDPLLYARTLRQLPIFEKLSLSTEDKNRTLYYQQEKLREQLNQSSASLEEFLQSLNISAEIDIADQSSLPRIAELTQKTNQFNLTTRRYSEPAIVTITKDDSWRIYKVRSRDRFGDNGLIGVAITEDLAQGCRIDTFLLSCRVIGRGIETALLAKICQDCKERGIETLIGEFIPTNKNQPASDFYLKHNFQKMPDTNQNWLLNLKTASITRPKWIS